MKTQITDIMSNVRDTWSKEERRERKEVAGALQLQLRALVVLSELRQARNEQENGALSVANAC